MDRESSVAFNLYVIKGKASMKVILLGTPNITDSPTWECIKYLSIKGIQVANDFKDIDWVISYGYQKRISKKLIDLAKIGCINFHPAPLPEFRGMGGVYNFALYEGVTNWGVSVHFVAKTFDTGDLIKCVRFKINPKKETVSSLKKKSHEMLMELFKETIDKICAGKKLKGTPQRKGRYVSRKDFEGLRKISKTDSLNEINRKIKAFWCPPHHGAYIKIKGEEFTLVNKEILNVIR